MSTSALKVAATGRAPAKKDDPVASLIERRQTP